MSPPPVPVGPDAPIMEVMATMRAMRRLKPDPVPDELLEKLVEAATWAPSGGNLQAYSFVVVTDRGQMARLAELWRVVCDFYLGSFATVAPDHMPEERHERLRGALRFQRDHFHETPAVIVACYELAGWSARLRGEWRRFGVAMRGLGPRRTATVVSGAPSFAGRSEAASVYPGVQNLLLAARAHGLGATLTTWHLALEPEFKSVLGIPRAVHTFALIPVGWPRGNFGPVRRQPAAEVIHRDRW
ncbi:MAG TPA: nitroreductase family protein [Solirubrobacteraceae bacterium]|jgi:nitroreductase|nr:nitroreductase family protein [Solirubrobacteraceae bacterium]